MYYIRTKSSTYYKFMMHKAMIVNSKQQIKNTAAALIFAMVAPTSGTHNHGAVHRKQGCYVLRVVCDRARCSFLRVLTDRLLDWDSNVGPLNIVHTLNLNMVCMQKNFYLEFYPVFTPL